MKFAPQCPFLTMRWLVCIVAAVGIHDIVTCLDRNKLLNSIEFFCGQTSICTNAKSRVADEKSCCQACSCDDVCAFTGNCCFPSTDVINVPFSDMKCLYPTTKIDPLWSYQYNTYYMMDVCMSEFIGGSPDPSCAFVKVAPWGSLFPVYSTVMTANYYNLECAECNTMTGTVPWTAILSCDLYGSNTHIPFDTIDHFSTFADNAIPDHCSVEFLPPTNLDSTDKKFFETRKCNAFDTIGTCGEDFEVPKDSPLSKNKIIKACEESGFVSPYFETGRYKNVFCHICNGQAFPVNLTCDNIELNGPKDKGIGKFTAVLSPDVYNNYITSGFFPQPDVICQATNMDNCKQIFCPSGQLYDSTGTCGYVSNNWLIDVYVFSVKLVPHTTLSLSGVDLSLEYLNNIFRFFLLKTLSVVELLAQIGNDKQIVQYFVITIKLDARASGYSPKQILEDVRLSFASNILLLTGVEKVLLTPEFLEYGATWMDTTSGYVIPMWYDSFLHKDGTDPTVLNGNLPSLKILGLADYELHGATLEITKMYFCKQIELQENDVEVIGNFGRILKSRITEKLYFEGEYVRLHRNEGFVYRVCVEGSGFVDQWQPDRNLEFVDSAPGPIDVGTSLSCTSRISNIMLLVSIPAFYMQNLDVS